MSYAPTSEKLATLGFGMPTKSFGKHASVTYYNIDRTKAVVVWPASLEVRLGAKPCHSTAWSDLYTGLVADEQAFDKIMVIEAFIMPEQLRAA